MVCIRETDNKELFQKITHRNSALQFSLLINSIEIGLQRGIECFDKYLLWSLNHIAVANLVELGGRFREEPVTVGRHIPPHFTHVPHEIDKMVSFVHLRWGEYSDNKTILPAYVLWRLNWIHPFLEGNGRTARAACYYLLCLNYKKILNGTRTVPELIVEHKTDYIKALKLVDQSWQNDKGLNLGPLVVFLDKMLEHQLNSV